LTKLARKGHLLSIFHLGVFYAIGFHVHQHDRISNTILNHILSQWLRSAHTLTYLRLLAEPSPTSCASYFNRGDALVQFSLGVCFEYGCAYNLVPRAHSETSLKYYEYARNQKVKGAFVRVKEVESKIKDNKVEQPATPDLLCGAQSSSELGFEAIPSLPRYLPNLSSPSDSRAFFGTYVDNFANEIAPRLKKLSDLNECERASLQIKHSFLYDHDSLFSTMQPYCDISQEF